LWEAAFGGLLAAKGLKRAPVEVTLIDRRNYRLFQPLPYQVATGALSPGEIASPLRHILSGATARIGRRRRPDSSPSRTRRKSRSRILHAFEAAELEPDVEKRRAWLTFVLIGGGRRMGALGEIANDTLRHDFRSINPAEARILLIEGVDRILSTFPPDLSEAAERSLIGLGVRTRTRALATEVDTEGVTVRVDGATQRIPARTALWSAGVSASPLGAIVKQRAGAILSVPGHPEILVIGDLASFSHQGGRPLRGVAPVAMQQGRYAGELIVKRLRGEPVQPFHYVNKGNLATIGHTVADFCCGFSFT